MAYPDNSSDINAGDTGLATQYNNLREDMNQYMRAQVTAGETINGASASFGALTAYIAHKNRLFPFREIYEQYSVGAGTNDSGCYGANYRAQAFSSGSYDTITAICLDWRTIGTGATGYIFEIFAVDGSNKPTGSALASYTWNNTGLDATTGNPTLILSTPLTVTPSTTYSLRVRNDSAGAVNHQQLRYYTSGTGAFYSTDSGATWTAGVPADATSGFRIAIYGYNASAITDGRAYKTDTTNIDKNFIDGFIYENKTAGQTVDMLWFGQGIPGLTSLSQGKDYYTSTTSGEILAENEAGVFLGCAVNTTTLVSRYNGKRLRAPVQQVSTYLDTAKQMTEDTIISVALGSDKATGISITKIKFQLGNPLSLPLNSEITYMGLNNANVDNDKGSASFFVPKGFWIQATATAQLETITSQGFY